MSRWTPSRAGILNVWRYYDEVFTFHKGRLLLRGPNGSGKSKVLELLLPYLLDGSLKASRLSTFGGTERTMHWNLMGDGASGTTRVGYVWLEFEHPDGRWFTCGARLSATVHTTNVTPAYFTTGLRVGDTLALADSNGRPLTKAQLATALGQDGFVHGSAEEYRTQVRQTLYRGLNETRYDSLLTALRQLRTPKLSERLDPGLLSDLLSSALPPLGEGEIHEIAEGFERLDRQREELKVLDGHVVESAKLLAKQQTYARRVLRAAAHGVTGATHAMEKAAAEMKARREAWTLGEEKLRRAEGALAETEEKRERLTARIDGLKEKDAYKAGSQLAQLRTDALEAGRSADGKVMEAERAVREGTKKAEAAATAKEDLRSAERQAAGAQADAASAGEAAGFGIERLAGTEVDAARSLLRAMTSARQGQVRDMRAQLADYAAAQRDREMAERSRDEAQSKLSSAREAAASARVGHDQQGRDLIEAYSAWPGRCERLHVDGAVLAALAEPLDEDSFALVDAMIEVARNGESDRLAERQSDAAHRRRLVKADRDRHSAERDNLSRRTDVTPPAVYTRPSQRAGRDGVPLWRALAFRDGIAEQAGIEAGIEAAGLLDLWVSADGGFDAEVWDAFAVPGNAVAGPSLADALVPEPDAPAAVARLLAAVALVPTAGAGDHAAAIGRDGTWRLGPAIGRWDKDKPSYIGASARERARLDRIAELDALIADLDMQAQDCDIELGAVADAKKELALEWAGRPDRGSFLEASRELDRRLSAVAVLEDGCHAAEEKVKECEKLVSAAFKRLGLEGARTGLPTTGPALDLLETASSRADIAIHAWLDARGRLAAARERWDAAEETAESYRVLAETATEDAAATRRRAEYLEERRAAVDSTLGASHREVLQQISDAQIEQRACEKQIKTLVGEVSDLKSDIRMLAKEHDDLVLDHGKAIVDRDTAAARFRHLAAGHLAGDAGLDFGLPGDMTVRGVLDAARSVGERLAKVPHEPKNIRDAETSLRETYHQVRDNLQSRADLELTPDDDVQILTATAGGVRLGLAAFDEAMRAERDERRSDITDSEHDLFDRTLAGDTRRHLADRIRQANRLVAEMNARLERVRTASNVAVQLVWQVDPKKSSGTRAARELLLRDPKDLGDADREALHRFFRGLLDEAKADDTARGWEEQLFKVLDYTAWHQFVVRLDRSDGNGWQELTRKLHGALSGGEKAIALHLPLFAAVAAHYQTDPGCPRFILLDEVFVGVDRANRGQVFELLVTLGLDLVLTSDHEWCDYRELDGIAIHVLQTGDGDDAVTTTRFIWTGHRIEPAA